MFDLRYHVASLAAVFLALIIGILVGVGIADRGYLDKGTRSLLEQRVADLQKQLNQTAQQAGNLGRNQDAARAYINKTYPVLVRNRLRGRIGAGRGEQCQRPQECRQEQSEAMQSEHGTRRSSWAATRLHCSSARMWRNW